MSAPVVVVVRLPRTFRLRIWLGMKIMHLGCWVAMLGYREEAEGGDGET